MAPFDDEASYQEFEGRVTTIPHGVEGKATFIVPFTALSSREVREQLRSVLAWTIEEIHRAKAGAARG